MNINLKMHDYFTVLPPVQKNLSDNELMEVISADHNYARTDDISTHYRQTKYLYTSKNCSSSFDALDVTSVPEPEPIEYDVEKSMPLMEECERFGIFVRAPRTEETIDDWEESIPRSGWSLQQANLFRSVCKILQSDRLARLALEGQWSEPARRRAHVDKSSKKFRQAMAAIAWDVRLTQWLHGLLVEYLDLASLAAYIDILQTLRARMPTLVERLLAGAVYGKTSVAQQGINLLLKRPWDPAVSVIHSNKLCALPGDPVILLIPSSLRKAQTTPRCNLWSSHLSSLATLITVSLNTGEITSKMTVLAYLEQMVSATKTMLNSARCDHPGRPIVLVGWRSGAAIALQVAASESIAAVVCLGLATRSVDGPRGEPNDVIYSVTCPILFITGEYSTVSRPDEIEDIRSKLGVTTGLVVVGAADSCLRMKRRQKIALGITQSLVDHSVLKATGDFLADVLVQPPNFNKPDRVPTNLGSRKRRISVSSSVDSESSSNRQEIPPKQPKTASALTYKAVNGKIIAPVRRGRKPGSLNKNKLGKTVKTLQTLSPIKKTQEVRSGESIKAGDVTIDVGSLASLGTIGPITRSPVVVSKTSPVSGSTTTTTTAPGPLQTFRIQAGRLSTASAPPADVMPTSSDQGATNSQDSTSPIMTLSPLTQRPLTLTPRATVTSATSRPSPKFSISSSNKIIPAQRTVMVTKDKRITPTPSVSPGQIKLTQTLRTTQMKTIKGSPIMSPMGKMVTPTNRLSISKRFIHTSPTAVQQKPIIIKSRATRTNESVSNAVPSGSKDVPLVIYKSGLAETHNKPKLYIQRGGGEPDLPVVIVKNRTISTESSIKQSSPSLDVKRPMFLKERLQKPLSSPSSSTSNKFVIASFTTASSTTTSSNTDSIVYQLLKPN